MNDFVPFPSPEVVRELYLVGFRLDPAAEAQFFTLIAHDGHAGRPPLANGRILFFASPSLAALALQMAENGMADFGALPASAPSHSPSAEATAASFGDVRSIDLVCDVAESLFLVNSQSEDADGVLLDCIACLDDLVRATRLNVPASYIAALNAVAERLEENPEFGSFLEGQGIDRETVEDAILWCVGAIAARSSWIGEGAGSYSDVK